ncbi:MAG: nicotinate phosphoribosyltransferase [Chloroflexi bacterium]|nr:nicotinate phosphoribosyltransferase [Chloroflexota bacterium]
MHNLNHWSRVDEGQGPSPALFTAFYELTMAQAYWQSGQTAIATFSLFVRRQPPDRGYFVFGGLGDILEHLEQFHYSSVDLDYLASLNVFDRDFLDYLTTIRFTGSVRAMREGSLFFANEPTIEVTAPIIEAQLLENFLLNRVNLHAVLTTKASRVTYAARGRAVTEFGSRRTPGLDAADILARVSYLVGFAGTGNVRSAARYGIPPVGTMAHSFVMSFGREVEAFRAYTHSFPKSSVLLVDTYDTEEGTRNAIRVAGEMRERGEELAAIRLDSGDLLALSLRCRGLLDTAGFPNIRIVASGDLDEFRIAALLEAGAPIDSFGVGTRLGTSPDAPSTDCVYKLVEYGGNPVLKLSPGKVTLVGPKQVWRNSDEAAQYAGDVISLAYEAAPSPTALPLLSTVMENGQTTVAVPPLEELRQLFSSEFAQLPERHKALRAPAQYPVVTSAALDRLQTEMADRAKMSARQA